MGAMLMWVVLVLSAFQSVSSEFQEQDCPEECDCHYFRVNYVTDCSESNLTEIPFDEISLNVYILDMNANEISEIEGFPEDIKLRRLQLAENKLTKITYQMFAGLKYIVDVDMSSNNISTVQPDSFRDSHGLITVELQSNPLLTVGAGPFLTCRSLLYLDISDCTLTALHNDFFTEIPLLNTLDLSGNPLHLLDVGVFKPLLSLQQLKLNRCRLTHLDPSFLAEQNHLKILELAENKLSAVDWISVLGNLNRLENLNLRKSGIKNLPEDVFGNNTWIRELDLSHNELSDLDIGITLGQNLRNLFTLELSSCNLTGPLDENSFSSATKLKRLNLANNLALTFRDLSVSIPPLGTLTSLTLRNCSLSKLPKNIFENLSQLKELDISWNPLNNVFVELLQPLTNLEYLNMGYSNLSKLSNDTFAKTTNLRTLILSGNKLRELETGIFKNLRNLESLEINNCWLERAIDEDVFFNKTYADLRELKMSGNPLKISQGSFIPEQLSQLNVLDISNCNISFLPDESFVNSRKLTKLFMSNNKLTSEFMNSTRFLDTLTNLEYLDMSSNNLTQLSIRVIEKTALRDIKLTSNPWVCDCTLAEWWNWASDKGDLAHLIGSTLTPEDFTVKSSKRKKALLCHYDERVTPPTRKNVTVTARRQRIRVETFNKTWVRYLKESNCPLKKVRVPTNDNPVPTFFPEPILPSPQPEFFVDDFQNYSDTEPGEAFSKVVALSVVAAAIVISLILGVFIRKKINIVRTSGGIELRTKASA